jgi:DNA-binding NtrC family response regulator
LRLLPTSSEDTDACLAKLISSSSTTTPTPWRLFRARFALAGHEATVCDNATRAVELLKTESFDVILSDVVMPGKSGLELLEELKKNGVKTPIVLISGQANIEMAVRATKLGALDFLKSRSPRTSCCSPSKTLSA